jgi:HlyD family secretion protein
MQVETALDEADIGQITEGLSVAFSVDAFPGRNFQGRVMQIRRAPIIQQNVVTYTVIVSANNADLRLLPGMTANVEIEVERREGILTIPNAALRFRPEGAGAPASQASAGGARAGGLAGFGGGGRGGQGGGQNLAAIQEQLDLSDDQVASLQDVGAETRANLQALRAGGAAREEFQDAIRGAREKFGQRLQEILTPEQREKFQALNPARQAQGNVRSGQTWVQNGADAPESHAIRYGLTDGSRTEVIDGELSEGDKIIIGQVRGKGGSRGFGLRF